MCERLENMEKERAREKRMRCEKSSFTRTETRVHAPYSVDHKTESNANAKNKKKHIEPAVCDRLSSTARDHTTTCRQRRKTNGTTIKSSVISESEHKLYQRLEQPQRSGKTLALIFTHPFSIIRTPNGIAITKHRWIPILHNLRVMFSHAMAVYDTGGERKEGRERMTFGFGVRIRTAYFTAFTLRMR